MYVFVFCSSFVFLFKQKTAYEMRISDWSSDVCSSDLSPFAQERKGCPDRHVALPDVAHGADVAAPRWLWASAPTVGAHGECGNSRPISARSVQYAGCDDDRTDLTGSGACHPALHRSARAADSLRDANWFESRIEVGEIGRAHV